MTKNNPDMTSTEVEADCREVNVFSVSKSYDTPDASVKYRYWSQTKTQVLWQEKHSGKFYYDGSRVWGGTSYRGYTGYHNCNQGWANGGYIEIINCTTYGGVSTYRIQPWDFYRTYAVVKGFGFSKSRDMHINAYPTGSFYSHWNG